MIECRFITYSSFVSESNGDTFNCPHDRKMPLFRDKLLSFHLTTEYGARTWAGCFEEVRVNWSCYHSVLHFPDTEGWDLFLNVTTFKTSSTSHSYSFTLNSISAIKVTLVWSDPAASSSSGKLLVNDLDVQLHFPSTDETVYPNGSDLFQ